jgi:hypothetical protein
MHTRLSLALPGKSDHNSILLIPAYKPKLKHEVQETRLIRKWPNEADAKLHHCFTSKDWNMLQDSSNNIEEFTTSGTGFISKWIDDDVPTLTVHTVHSPTRSHELQATSLLS